MAEPLPLVVFAATFLLLAARRLGRIPLERGPVALMGGLVMVLIGALSPIEALAAVDLGTLALLTGMMLLGAVLADAGLFSLAAGFIARHTRNERGLVAATLVGSAVLSALFLNDTIALFLPPVLFLVLRAAGLPVFRTFCAAALGVNIGSLWTPVGNPQNAYLATVHDIGFLDFAVTMTPLVIVGLVTAGLLLVPGAARTPFASPAAPAPHRPLPLAVGLVGAGVMLLLFLFSPLIGLPLWAVALTIGGAVFLLVPALTPERDGRRILHKVDGNLLLLFAGLFVLVAAAEATGIVRDLFHLLPLAAATPLGEVARITVATFVLSNLFSNVPAVLILDPLVSGLDGATYPLLLAAASTLAGNTTVLASAATLIIAEQAEAHGERFPFWRFAAIGATVTAVTLVATVLYFAGLTH